MKIFGNSVQKARKDYPCDECEWTILPGETYSRYVWIVDSGTCFVIRKHYSPNCPESAFAEPPEEPAAQALSMRYVMRQVAVQRILLNGTTETRYEPKCILVVEDTPEPEYGDDDDVPF